MRPVRRFVRFNEAGSSIFLTCGRAWHSWGLAFQATAKVNLRVEQSRGRVFFHRMATCRVCSMIRSSQPTCINVSLLMVWRRSKISTLSWYCLRNHPVITSKNEAGYFEDFNSYLQVAFTAVANREILVQKPCSISRRGSCLEGNFEFSTSCPFTIWQDLEHVQQCGSHAHIPRKAWDSGAKSQPLIAPWNGEFAERMSFEHKICLWWFLACILLHRISRCWPSIRPIIQSSNLIERTSVRRC